MAEAAESSGFTYQEYFSAGERKRLTRLPHLIRIAIRIVRAAAQRDLILCAVLQISSGGAVAVQLLVVRKLLGTLLQGHPPFATVLPEVVALTVVAMGVAATGAVLTIRSRLLAQLVTAYTMDKLVETTTRVDLITYEEPGFHDRLQRAQISAGARPVQMVNSLIGTIGSLTSIAGVVGALIIIQPLFALLVLVAYTPTWLATNRASRLFYAYSVEQSERERLRSYLFELLSSKPYAQEIRAFDLGDYLAKRQQAVFQLLFDDLKTVMDKRLRTALVGQALTGLLTAGSIGLLVAFVTSGRMSLSAAGSAAGAMFLLSGRLRGLAGGAGGLYESSLYLEDFTTFVDAAPRIAAQRPRRQVEAGPELIEARNLSFTYPSRSEPSLTDVSLSLRRGEVVALVGENGSGKTTLAKLLAGLYSPHSGAISWDGTDIALYDPVSIRTRVAVIFQDFIRYVMTAHDNIAFGDHVHSDDDEAVARAAAASGMGDMLAGLPNGYDTILGPQFLGGSDLSGGQWQRVALSRAFFRDTPLVILDEPTAALDPRAEADLYASMGDLFTQRAVLLISHRFGSVRTADRIYVLRDGRVHESGSHDELIAADGYYAELFRLQASMYRD